MGSPRIHLIAPAGSCRPFFEAVGIQSATELIAIVKEAVGPDYQVTGAEPLIEAGEDERHGGRTDDRQRADDLERAFADEGISAIVLVRGGAWFTRILPLIDFSVLDRRTRPVVLFGFSELTPLVNIVASRRHGLGVYDMGPAFLTYGLKRHAATAGDAGSYTARRPASWMRGRLRPEFDAFFRDVIAMIEGRGTSRPITARLARGQLLQRQQASFIGGNLTALSTLLGSRYAGCVDLAGRWVVLEDFNDKLERVDRFLAHLTLAGYWDCCEGILLGNFHKGYEELTPAVLELLGFHIPAGRSVPVLVTNQIGHVWPMSPLPLHLDLTIERIKDGMYSIHWPASALRTV